MATNPSDSTTLPNDLPTVGASSRAARRRRVYALLLEGHFHPTVARTLRVTPRAIQSMASTLVKQGILEEIPRSFPKTYRRGPRAATFERRAHIRYMDRTPPPDATRKVPPNGDMPAARVRFHGAAVRFEVLQRPPDLPGWRAWTAGKRDSQGLSGVPMARTTLEVDGTSYTVELRGMRSPIIIVHIPEMYVDSVPAYLEAHTRMGETAQRVAKEVVHRFMVAIDPTPILHQKPEIAFEDENGFFALSKECLLRLNGYAWTDSSKGFMEWETTDFEMGLLAFAIPKLLREGKLKWVDEAPGARQDSPHGDSSEPSDQGVKG